MHPEVFLHIIMQVAAPYVQLVAINQIVNRHPVYNAPQAHLVIPLAPSPALHVNQVHPPLLSGQIVQVYASLAPRDFIQAP